MSNNELRRQISTIFAAMRGSGPLYKQWCTDEIWCKIINHHMSTETSHFSISTATFNQTMVHNRHGFISCESFDGSNSTGVFRCKYSKTWYYYVTDPGEQIPYPVMDDQWFDKVRPYEKELINLLPSLLRVQECHRTINDVTTSEATTATQATNTSVSTLMQQTPEKAISITKRSRDVTPDHENHIPPKRSRRETKIFNVAPPKKGRCRIEGGKKTWERFSKKVAKKARAPLLKLNAYYRRRLNAINKKSKKSEERIQVLIDKLNNQQGSHESTGESDIELETKLIDKLGQLLGSHMSNMQKAENVINAVMKRYKINHLPKEVVRKEVRCVYLPEKIGMYI
jgi:hypothetical protein